jgi:hypothetical protein
MIEHGPLSHGTTVSASNQRQRPPVALQKRTGMRLRTLTTRLDYDFMSSSGERSLGGPGIGLVQVSEGPRDALRRHVCCYNVQVHLFGHLAISPAHRDGLLLFCRHCPRYERSRRNGQIQVRAVPDVASRRCLP